MRQVREEENKSKIDHYTETIRREGDIWGNRADAAVTVSGSAEQENGQGFEASLRPKIN